MARGETEEAPICSQCKTSQHNGHCVLPMQRAVKERKARLAAAAQPLRERLDALRNGSAESPNATEHIKAVVKKGEMQIRREFEKLSTFLKKEQEARLEAVREAGIQETWQAREAIDTRATLLSDRVREAEELAKEDDIAFLQKFNAMKLSIELSRPDPAWCPWTMTDVPKQLGNLRFNVWKKMKEIAPYYPVILAPSSPHLSVALSDDLTSVTAMPVLDPSAPPSTSYTLVVGSEAFYDGCHAWDVHVGDSSDWVVGVTASEPVCGEGPVSLSPSGGYWAIQRREGGYFALTSPPTPLSLPSPGPLKVLRVKLLWALTLDQNDNSIRRVRKVTFSDAQKGWGSAIFSFSLEGHWPLYPFLCPRERGAMLRIEQVEVKVELKEALWFWERCPSEFIILGFLCVFVILSCMILFSLVQ